MWEWVKDHVEWIVGGALATAGAAIRFALHREREFRDLQHGHAALRKDFDDHMGEAKPMMAQFIAVKAQVESLEDNLNARFDAMEQRVGQAVDELRTDFRTLNTLLVSVLKRGFGGIRDEDEARVAPEPEERDR